MHPTQMNVDDLMRHCDIRRQRRSGPGGQHRNKVETGIFVRHRETGIVAEATEKRSQSQNQVVALERLRVRLAIEYRTPGFDPTQSPSQLWRQRCRGGRIVVSRGHHDFAVLLSEMLDVLVACDLDFPHASEQLECSRSQLTKLLSAERAALHKVNQWRAERDQRPLQPRK